MIEPPDSTPALFVSTDDEHSTSLIEPQDSTPAAPLVSTDQQSASLIHPIAISNTGSSAEIICKCLHAQL